MSLRNLLQYSVYTVENFVPIYIYIYIYIYTDIKVDISQ